MASRKKKDGSKEKNKEPKLKVAGYLLQEETRLYQVILLEKTLNAQQALLVILSRLDLDKDELNFIVTEEAAKRIAKAINREARRAQKTPPQPDRLRYHPETYQPRG